MTMIRLMTVPLVICLSASPLYADNRTARPDTSSPARIADLAVLAAGQQSLVPPAQGPGFNDWSARLERARAGRQRGLRVMLTGIGMSAAGGLLIALNRAKESYYGGTDDYNRAVAVLGITAGGGVAALGGYMFARAGNDITSLEREGRTNGYLTVFPAPRKDVQFAMRFRF